jgi:signal transduction histidine kinase/GAF domain-containing protein
LWRKKVVIEHKSSHRGKKAVGVSVRVGEAMDSQDGKIQATIGEESNILERVARVISSVRGAKPDYAHLAAELEPALPFDILGIVLLRHDRQAVRVMVCRREEENWVAHYHQHPLIDSMVERISGMLPSQSPEKKAEKGRIASPGSTLGTTTDDLFTENFPEGAIGLPNECGDALCGHPQLRAVLIAPLVAGEKLLGTLELGSTMLNAYSELSLQRLIQAIARVLGTAIDGAQVGGNVEIQDRQRAELKDVSTVLTTAVDLQMILDRIVVGITNALHVASAIVRFDRKHSLCLAAQSGLDSRVLQEVLEQQLVSDDQTIIGSTLLHRQARVSPDIAQDERFPASRAFASELNVRSIFCYPLITGQYVYGVLLLLSPESGGFTPLKQDIFALFAGQATVAIQNGMLLQSAQERRRFQEMLEQFKRSNQQNVFASQDEQAEQALFKRLREETQSTFGVSLGSILHFISDHLLTRSERHLQDILSSFHDKTPAEESQQGHAPSSFADPVVPYAENTTFVAHWSDIKQFARARREEETAYLGEVADAALASTDFLKNISTALMNALHVDETNPQAYDDLKRKLAEPWLIVDLAGTCIYLNRAGEVFCRLHETLNSAHAWNHWSEANQTLFSSFRPLSARQETSLTLERALEAVFPRMRQLKDVLAYLREFTVSEFGKEISGDPSEVQASEASPLPTRLRCAIAAEPLPGQVAHQVDAPQSAQVWSVAELQEPRAIIAPPCGRVSSPPTMLLESSPSDRHYQFIRHALYNEYGKWFANALHIHDITEQVRDEKNKSVLLASVSHDLRTPLTAIKAAVTGLLQPEVVWKEDLRREMLEDIDASADHLHALINALVEMSRIEMGALSLDKEWCDVVELVQATLANSRHMLADFIVKTHIQSPLPQIFADYTQLGHVLYNLLENAVRHSPRHTVLCVNVDLLTQSDLPLDMLETVSRGVRIQIIDQGPGVPEEERERIFKSFYSLDVHGNGLGLAICRGIVEAHQGRIWVEAGVGKGSCFVFVLPITS